MVKADVVYDKNQFAKFMKFTTVDKPWKWIIYIVATILVTVSLITNIGDSYLSLYIIIAVLIAIIDFFILFSYFILPIVKLKNFTEEQNISNHFEFDEKEIRFSSESKLRKGSAKILYQQIFQIKESKTTIYIYVNRKSALIVDKSCITEGSVKTLKALLKEKVPDRRNKLGK